VVTRDPNIPLFEALIIPNEALERGGVEVLRAAIIEGQLHVTLRRTFEQPDPWGGLLSEVARRVARAYAADGQLDEGEVVFEGDRPQRRKRGAAGKSDQLDAIKVAREALARPHHAVPRQRGQREAMRVLLSTRQGAVNAYKQGLNQLYALVVSAPEPTRERLIQLKGERLIKACTRVRSSGELESRVTAATLRQIARRLNLLRAEADDYERQLTGLIHSIAPELLAEPGVGPITAAQLLISWSHAGRIRNEGAFAAMTPEVPTWRTHMFRSMYSSGPFIDISTSRVQSRAGAFFSSVVFAGSMDRR